jgi:hypothetical protein
VVIRRRTRSIVALLVFVAMPFAMVQACGPDWSPDTFVRKTVPDDLKSFAKGRLGILQTGYDSNELVVAYRYLNGGRLSEIEQKEYLPAPSVERNWRKMTSEQISAARDAEDAARPVNQWRAARAKYVPKDAQAAKTPGLPDDYRAFNNFYDSENQRCADASFQNAVLTLTNRAAKWGGQSPWLADWIRGQDAVFANCAGKMAAVPGHAAEGSPALLQADRQYQIAAAAFYAGQLNEARAGFDAVADDQGSPWRYLGRYLAARATVRKAFAMGSKTDPYNGDLATFDMKTMQEAQAMLEGLLQQHDPALKRETVLAELNFVRMRTEPEQRVAEICAALVGPGADANFGQDLSDLNYVLIKRLEIKKVPLLLAWLRALRAGGASGDSFDAWKKEGSVPWLVVAMMKAGAKDPFAPDLLQAAAQIKPGEPAYDTVAFHRVRLLTELGRGDEARTLLDQILPAFSSEIASSRLNAFRGERMAVARTLDEFLTYAPRVLLDFNSQGAGSLSWECNASASASRTQGRCPDVARTLKFDEDAVFVMNRQMPLTMLAEAANSARLPRSLQQELVLAAWTRSIVLEDAKTATNLAPMLPESIRKIAGGEIGFHAALAILRNPGLRPYLEPGISHLASFAEFDIYRGNWWCDYWQGQFEHDPWTTSDSRPVTFLRKEQTDEAGTEFAKLRAMPCAPAFLGQRVIDYAKTNPADPDIPEALALTVRATRYGCTEWGIHGNDENAAKNSETSKAAFRLLHSKYPKSPWTEKTRYYY